MPLGQDYVSQECSVARALEVVGERWTLLVVRDAFFGVRRFGDFQRRLGIPKAVLATRLADLVGAGVLERVELRPRRPDYVLTDRGRDLWPVVHGLYSWGEAHATERPGRRGFRHASCAVELDGRGRCPACGELPAPEDIDMVTGARRRSAPHHDRAAPAPTATHRLLEPLLP